MTDRAWSRRELATTVGTGVLGLGVAWAVSDALGQYVVGATDDGAVTAAASVSDAHPARIDLTEYTATTLVRGAYTAARCETLRAREDVAFVQPDHRLHYVTDPVVRRLSTVRADAQPETDLPWGIDRVDADVAHAEGETGDGARAAIVDGGIDATNPDLEANLADPSDADAHEAWVRCEGDCAFDWDDDGGHGSHVAGIAAANGTVVGVAPDATLHALKVCGANGGCRTSAVAEALRYAADHGWDVANLSLGSPRPSPALQAAGEYAREAGLLPVAAAGNRGRPDSVGYPAAYDAFLAVAATTVADEIADFSSTGPEVNLAAPGAEICSTTPDGHDLLSGTSMAAPHVAGAAATLRANGASVAEAETRLLDTAEDIGASDTRQGAGLLDVAAALGYDSDDDGTGAGTTCPP